MRFAAIQKHAMAHAIGTMCRVLRLSKAWYYAWVKRPPTWRTWKSACLKLAFHES